MSIMMRNTRVPCTCESCVVHKYCTDILQINVKAKKSEHNNYMHLKITTFNKYMDHNQALEAQKLPLFSGMAHILLVKRKINPLTRSSATSFSFCDDSKFFNEASINKKLSNHKSQ